MSERYLHKLTTDQWLECFSDHNYPNDQFYCYIQHKPNGKPFYVGKGKRDRWRSERKAHYNSQICRIIKKYGIENIKTDIFVLTSEAEAFIWEKELIYMFRCQGINLANATDGGDGFSGLIRTQKHLDNMSKAQRGRILTEEHKAKLSRAQSGKPAPFKGRTHTQETIRKLSQIFSGKPSVMKGKKHTPEVKLKMSLAAKNRAARKIQNTYI